MEVLHRSVADRHAVIACAVVDADLPARTALRSQPVDGMTSEVDGDAWRPDDEAGPLAADEVGAEGGIGSEHTPAPDRLGGRGAGQRRSEAERQDRDDDGTTDSHGRGSRVRGSG